MLQPSGLGKNPASSGGNLTNPVALLFQQLSLVLTAGFLAVLVFTSCATEPTHIREQRERAKYINDWKIPEKAAFLDARPEIAHSAARVPKSWLVRWWDFTESEPKKRGWLQSDVSEIARKLSQRGVAPDVPVFVLGAGFDGHGEEGRIAWMLTYLGLKDIRVANFEQYKGKLESGPAENFISDGSAWEPKRLDVMVMTRQEMSQRLKSGKAASKDLRCLDVGVNATSRKVNGIKCIHFEWKKLFHENMIPKESAVDELEKMQILPAYEIVLVSQDGVESGAATYALQKLGFSGARNYAGGWLDFP